MLLLGLSILLIVYVVNIFVKLIYLNHEAHELETKLDQLIIDNQEIQGESVINNGDLTITVLDNYMTDGETVYTFPK